jgi:hypothetical protein
MHLKGKYILYIRFTDTNKYSDLDVSMAFF